MTNRDIAGMLTRAGVKRVATQESMARHTSWRIGGPADYLCVAEDEQQLRDAIGIATQSHVPWLVLGGGNNILVSDAGIEGIVILNRVRGLAIEPYPDGVNEKAVLACGAGVFFARAAQYSAREGYTGLEWGIAIPGTVGGGVVNNAGAHASEVSQALLSADIVTATGQYERLQPSDLAYRYRQSALKTPHTAGSSMVVTSCRFTVSPEPPHVALSRIEELRIHRLRTQPVKEASAGSTFKNPPGEHAGALIDRAGLKGKEVGGAQIAPLHANFILNRGGASARDVLQLIRAAQEAVRRQSGIELEPEVQLVGRWTPEDLRSITPMERSGRANE